MIQISIPSAVSSVEPVRPASPLAATGGDFATAFAQLAVPAAGGSPAAAAPDRQSVAGDGTILPIIGAADAMTATAILSIAPAISAAPALTVPTDADVDILEDGISLIETAKDGSADDGETTSFDCRDVTVQPDVIAALKVPARVQDPLPAPTIVPGAPAPAGSDDDTRLAAVARMMPQAAGVAGTPARLPDPTQLPLPVASEGPSALPSASAQEQAPQARPPGVNLVAHDVTAPQHDAAIEAAPLSALPVSDAGMPAGLQMPAGLASAGLTPPPRGQNTVAMPVVKAPDSMVAILSMPGSPSPAGPTSAIVMPANDVAAPTGTVQPGVSLPMAPQPAAQAFAAAIFDAERCSPAAESNEHPDALGLAPIAGLLAPTTSVAVTATTSVQAQTLDLGVDGWMGTMIDRIETLQGEGVREARIRLTPDALGSIDLAIHHDDDGIQVRITAETAQTRAILSDAAPRLADMAEARGLKLGSTQVDAGAAGQQHRDTRRDEAPAALLRPAPAQSGDDDASSTDSRIA